MTVDRDTIVAPATPPGRGGVAIIRVSGPKAQAIGLSLLNTSLKPRQATYLPFLGPDNQIIDQGIALFFPNPHSFTGEDVLELQGHGGPVVVDLLLQHIVRLGARLAKPGEFSERAFLNGKLDLTQAEAIADLIDASSTQAARLALRSLQGAFSKEIHALTEQVVHLRTYIEAAIDFSDEEIDFLSQEKLLTTLQAILKTMANIQAQARQSSMLREGITAVIAGEPNVGKSSLLNALSGKELAIVTALPGTTRDVLRDHITIDGMPMHLLDTAGLRETTDVVEQEGVRRAEQEVAQADLILYMIDASSQADPDPKLMAKFPERPVIIIHNKIDLVKTPPTTQTQAGHTHVFISAQAGTGLSLLREQIKTLVGFSGDTGGQFLARRRHLEALARAQTHLEMAHLQLVAAVWELAAEELRLAQNALNEITGEFSADDLLGKIFSSFCIGK